MAQLRRSTARREGPPEYSHEVTVTNRRVGNVVAAAAKSLQSCPTLCDPSDCSLPGSSVNGIFQARVLEWGAIAFSERVP